MFPPPPLSSSAELPEVSSSHPTPASPPVYLHQPCTKEGKAGWKRNHDFVWSVSRLVSQPGYHPVSHPVSRPVSRPVSSLCLACVSPCVSPLSHAVSPRLTWSLTQSLLSHPLSHPVSLRLTLSLLSHPVSSSLSSLTLYLTLSHTQSLLKPYGLLTLTFISSRAFSRRVTFFFQ